MRGDKKVPESVDEYIADFPAEVQAMLNKIRAAIKKAAPKAEESISYMMPAYKLNGPLVYFAGYKKHLGFYPGAAVVDEFKTEIEKYHTSKGTIQLPLDKPIPVSLLAKIVKFRVAQNLEKALKKKK